MSNTLTITLKQHTPIIHFQHAQPGATLRATEVKPKINGFIKNHFQSFFRKMEPELYEKYKHLVCEKYFPLKGEPVIAPFQLSISPKGKQQELIAKSIFSNKEGNPDREISENRRLVGSFFGDTDQFRALFYKDGISIKIFSLVSGMADFIYAVIPYIVAVSNFGCRQSKGFGCFSATKLNDQDQEIFNQNWHEKVWRSFSSFNAVFRKNNATNGFQNQIKAIKNDYQLLKSGKNGPGQNDYAKSQLFLYMVDPERNIRWEKRKIKQFIGENEQSFEGKELYAGYDPRSSPTGEVDENYSLDDPTPPYDYRFVRALLGLAEQHEYLIWGYNDKEGNPKADNKLKYAISFKHLPDKGNSTIERFGSPILFKVYGQSVYAIASTIDKDIFDQAFKLTLSLKGETTNKTKIDMEDELRTPKSTEFDLVDFLDNYLDGYTKV